MDSKDDLNDVFLALADPTRRAVIRSLGSGPASVGELARPFDMALPSFLKHIRALEKSGLVRTTKSGRVRTCVLDRQRVSVVGAWLAEERALWEGRTDRLVVHIATDAADAVDAPVVSLMREAVQSGEERS
ncbi:ArsR/SmtB family transcription factor [Microbacterium sp. NPDC089695]|uniref:ArsR/SmtB family transcription factor n=1 Tax=Microbacterium sp. NPDC089695 TaxID=3364198 RepID=UPI003805FFB3